MKKLLLLLVFCGAAAYAQPAFVQSDFCPSAIPCQLPEPDPTYVSATSVRISFKTDIATQYHKVKCGTSSGNYAYEHLHAPSSPGILSTTKGEMLLFSGLKPSTTYYCVATIAVARDGSGTQTVSPEFTVTTAARAAGEWDRIPDPDLPDTMTMPTPDVSYNATCATFQDVWDNTLVPAHNANPNLNREIVLPAGSVCTGPWIYRNHKTGTGWVIVRSSAVGTTNFPPAGVRVDPVRYRSQFVRVQNAFNYFSADGNISPTNSNVYTIDGSSRIWMAGITLEPVPGVDLWSRRTSTCTASGSADVSVAVSNIDHNLATGNRVKITNSSNVSLNNQFFTITKTANTTFTLDGTAAIGGGSSACTVNVLSDMKLANCTAGTGGVIRCDTVDESGAPVLHGLVEDQVVKVISPDTVFPGDWVSYQGAYGFGGRTDPSITARTDRVSIVDGDTVEFQGRIPNGTYEGGARLLADGPIIGINFYSADPPNASHHLVLDRVWAHTRSMMFKAGWNIRMACDLGDCLIRDSVIDPNYEGSFTYGTTWDIRSFSFVSNPYNVNIDRWYVRCAAINNEVGYTLVGMSAASGSSTTTPASHLTFRRNTYYFPDHLRPDPGNPNSAGLNVPFMREPLELKAGQYIKIDGNRFFGMVEGQSRGGAIFMSSRPNVEGGSSTATTVRASRVYGILITNNSIFTSGVGISLMGSNSNDSHSDTPALRKATVSNNIIVVDATRYRVYPTKEGLGDCFMLTHGPENVVIERNFCLQRGSYGNIIASGAPKAAGWKIRNNIFTIHSNTAPLYPINFPANSTEIVPIDPALAWGTTSWQQLTRGLLQIGGSVNVVGGTSAGTYQHLDPDFEFHDNVFITGMRGALQQATVDTSTTSTVNTSLAQCKADLGGLIDSQNYPRNICYDAGASLSSGKDSWLLREATLGLANFSRTAGAHTPSHARQYDLSLIPASPFKSGWRPATSTWAARPLNPVVGQRWKFSDTNCSGVAGAATTCVYTGPLGWSASTDACTLYGQCMAASDGADLGPDMEALESAQGLVKNARVLNTTTTTAQLAYLAPDSAACSIDYWTGSDTPTRVSDGGGPRSRAPVIGPLLPGSSYNWILQCAVEQPSGTFTTK